MIHKEWGVMRSWRMLALMSSSRESVTFMLNVKERLDLPTDSERELSGEKFEVDEMYVDISTLLLLIYISFSNL